ncbi:hypothetical protein [Ureibacillus chungkukjangi]|uniref:hypothetical protein n=1 Tax=Ureibacillus chungkukjangi TaxID=1202712 RepID=UPI00203A750D|nr:hypothetical protein [Ureibacillus chungkukjangi]
MNSYGGNIQEAVSKATKRTQEQQIIKSPNLKYVKLNSEINPLPCIVSNVDGFMKRKFLFVPETSIDNGDLIHYENYTYLTVKNSESIMYPEATTEVCNESFIYKIEGTKTNVGKDDFGRPIYETSEPTIHNIPCVLSDKTTTTDDNSPLLLPEGTIEIKIPYKIGQIPSENYTFEYRDSPYKVKTISYENVINNVGFIVMRLERVIGGAT